MSYVILVPLLPLLAALVIGVAGRSLRERSAKVGGAAVVAAFLGALVTLVAVSSNGPISVRFYEPASGTSLGFPVGLHRPPECGHDGVDLGCEHHHLSLFHALHAAGTRLFPISCAAGLHDLCTSVHGFKRQPVDAVYFLATPDVAALPPVPPLCSSRNDGGCLQNLYALTGGGCGLSIGNRLSSCPLRNVGVPAALHQGCRRSNHRLTLAG